MKPAMATCKHCCSSAVAAALQAGNLLSSWQLRHALLVVRALHHVSSVGMVGLKKLKQRQGCGPAAEKAAVRGLKQGAASRWVPGVLGNQQQSCRQQVAGILGKLLWSRRLEEGSGLQALAGMMMMSRLTGSSQEDCSTARGQTVAAGMQGVCSLTTVRQRPRAQRMAGTRTSFRRAQDSSQAVSLGSISGHQCSLALAAGAARCSSACQVLSQAGVACSLMRTMEAALTSSRRVQSSLEAAWSQVLTMLPLTGAAVKMAPSWMLAAPVRLAMGTMQMKMSRVTGGECRLMGHAVPIWVNAPNADVGLQVHLAGGRVPSSCCRSVERSRCLSVWGCACS